jgi:hypothetical protein
LVRDRACYFEVPKALLKDSLIIRFSGFLLETQDINVSVRGPLAAPTPTPVAKVEEEIKDRWNEPELSKPSESPPQATPVPEASPPTADVAAATVKPSYEFIQEVNSWLDAHNWQSLTLYTVSGQVNYFGHRNCSNGFVERDMSQDARNYTYVHSTIYPDTFSRSVGIDGITYDEINVESAALERTGEYHHALTRLIVGYTGQGSDTKIYAPFLKVVHG